MEKTGMAKIKNKKEKNIADKRPVSSIFFASVLRFNVAIAIFFLLAIVVNAGDVVVESGKLDVSGNLFVDSAGKVGIGTTAPGKLLSVIGAIASGEGTASDTDGRISMTWDATNNEGIIGAYQAAYKRIYFDANPAVFNQGKVGIGTTNPGSELHVQGQLKVDSAINDKIILAGTQAEPHTIFLDNSKGVRFWDNVNGELLRVTNTGNAGIGTTAPDHKLQIVSNNGNLLRLKNTAGGDFRLLSTASGEFGIYDETNSAYRMYAKGANVGIGTTAPTNKLHIQYASGVGTAGMLIENTQEAWGSSIQFKDKFTGGSNDLWSLLAVSGSAATDRYLSIRSADGEKFRVQQNGRVGIGTSNPVVEFHVKGYQNIESRDGTKDCQLFVVSDGACGGGATSLWSSGGATLCVWCGTA